MSERVCQGCGTPLPSRTGPGRDRKWCSERCRRETLYATACIDCGKRRYSNGPNGTSRRCSTCARIVARSMAARRAASERSRSAAHLKYTDDEVFAAIRSVADDGRVSVDRYRSDVQHRGLGPGVPALIWRFGSWRNAVHAAGLLCAKETRPERYANRMDDEGLLAALEDCAADLGHWPGAQEYEQWCVGGRGPSLRIFGQRFGSWFAAVDLVAKRWGATIPGEAA